MTNEAKARAVHNYWVRWYAGEEPDFELHAPWWNSGSTFGASEECQHLFVAAIRAHDSEHAWATLLAAYDAPPSQFERSYCEQRAEDWTPGSDRFPMKRWMIFDERTTEEVQAMMKLPAHPDGDAVPQLVDSIELTIGDVLTFLQDLARKVGRSLINLDVMISQCVDGSFSTMMRHTPLHLDGACERFRYLYLHDEGDLELTCDELAEVLCEYCKPPEAPALPDAATDTLKSK